MQVLEGHSELNCDRRISLDRASATDMRVRIFHPEERSGAMTQVRIDDLRRVLESRRGALPGTAEHEGKPLSVRREATIGRDEFHLWIHGVGDNGWSILINRRELLDAFEAELSPQSS